MQVDSLHEAARAGDCQEVVRLIALDPSSVNDRDHHSRTPLHLAAWAGHADVVRLLSSANADVGAAASDDMAAIHFASQKGFLEVVRTLLAGGAYVNAKTRKGMTPLHFAVQGGYVDLTKLLINRGANLSVENKAHKTPFDFARDEDFRALIKRTEHERNLKKSKSKQQPSATPREEIERDDDVDKGKVGKGEEIVSSSGQSEKESDRMEMKEEGRKKTTKLDETRTGDDETAVFIGPRLKKTKVSLTHLFTESEDIDQDDSET